MEHSFDDTMLPLTTITSGILQKVKPDLYCLPVQIVNICLVGNPQGRRILLDAGMPGSANLIIRSAEEHYKSKPEAIILTHAHFDHVGAIIDLINYWRIPYMRMSWSCPI